MKGSPAREPPVALASDLTCERGQAVATTSHIDLRPGFHAQGVRCSPDQSALLLGGQTSQHGRMTRSSKMLMWVGIGLCVASAAGLVVGGVVDLSQADPWASVIGGAAGLFGLALTLYGVIRSKQAAGNQESGFTARAAGIRSVAAGRHIGSVSTGDRAAPSRTPRAKGPKNAPSVKGGVAAEGERSVAAGGDIGNASTGDA